MQRALLSAAIALILVLVTALVGPLFVDWGRYRNTFETEISRLTGLDVRIAGPVDVRLLPTPTLKLQQIALGRPDGPARVRAQALRIELALGALMRGQFLASDVGLEAPEISLRLGGSERFEWSPPLFAFDPDAISIAHLAIEKGRLTLADGSGRSLLLDRLGFSGEVRSLLGPAKGEGSVAVDGESYLFRIAADRAAVDGAVKVRLLVDTVDRVRIGDVDSSIWIERGIPHFAGTLQWSQAGGRSTQGFSEQWRVSAKMRGNWAAAMLEGINLQYGSEDRAVQLRGHANLTFRAQPELDVTLSATQIDLDRVLALPAPMRRRPLAAVRTMADNFGAARLPPIHVNFGISAEVVTLADAPLQHVSASLRGEAGAWDLDALELRAPGGTQLRLRGRLDLTAQGTTFAGRGRIEARDSRTLVSWLTAGSDGEAFAGPFRAESDVRLGGESIVFDQMTGTVAGSDIAGRLAIDLSSPTMSLDGDIRLGAVDLPAVIAAAVGMPAKRAGGGLAWPADPFAGGVVGQFRGRIAMASARTMLTSNLVAENLHGALNFGPSDITLDDFQADIAGGRVSGRLAIERNGDELGARSRVRLTRADMTALLPGDRPPMSGRLNLDAEIEGRGRSPVALIGSLQGKGSFSIEDGRFARLDPSAFDAVIRSVDQGLPIEVTRIKERMEAALARGALSIQGDGSITTAAGQASLTVTKLRAKGADMAISARYDLVAEALDARLTLVGPTGIGAVDIGRPEIAISLQGPIDSPRRTLDIAALSNWLSTRAIAQNAKRLAAISAPLDARPIEPPQTSAAATRPAVPANSVAVVKPLPPPDGVKTDAIPPNLARPEPAASAVAAVKSETPANPPSAAKSAADAFAATKPPPYPPPQAGEGFRLPPPQAGEGLRLPPPLAGEGREGADPPSTARDTAGVGVPGEANLAPARSPADAGIAELDRAIAANPNDGAALAKRGQTFATRGNYGFAIKDFDEVIRLRPRDAEAFNNRCWARAIIGDLESALTDCNAALQLRPRYADAFDSRGMINLKSGQLGKAIADYDAALRINPKLASSLYGRGIAKIKNDHAAGGNLDIVEAKSIQANVAEEFAGYGIR